MPEDGKQSGYAKNDSNQKKDSCRKSDSNQNLTKAGNMTEAEKKERIRKLRAELKELEATPRSDWHAGFEALLRIQTHRYGDRVQIRTENPLGEKSPRADFVIVVDEEGLLAEHSVFRIFRRQNIVEYKNPHDDLNERAVRKACGYANLYIGVSEHEGDVPSKEVTLSIFRASRPEKFFRTMEETGQLVRGTVKGIYHIKGIIDLPFQIVITSELEGEEYAAYRALTDNASGADIGQVIRAGGLETDFAMQEHYRTVLNLIAGKNPSVFEEIRRDSTMEITWMDIFKDAIDERVNAREQNTRAADIRSIMKAFGVSEEKAMESLEIPQNQRAVYAELLKQA